jgi:hypothetical protein
MSKAFRVIILPPSRSLRPPLAPNLKAKPWYTLLKIKLAVIVHSRYGSVRWDLRGLAIKLLEPDLCEDYNTRKRPETSFFWEKFSSYKRGTAIKKIGIALAGLEEALEWCESPLLRFVSQYVWAELCSDLPQVCTEDLTNRFYTPSFWDPIDDAVSPLRGYLWLCLRSENLKSALLVDHSEDAHASF